MTVSLSNPIDVFANAIAQPLEDAAREWRELAKMHETGNDHLRCREARSRQPWAAISSNPLRI
ncbi:MAG TPA: hypothetical protein VFB60_15055 [Ktedonobacteraceae bacterium]|nr:hypothetical protein [Ktedonobacteraceae bacterium]